VAELLHTVNKSPFSSTVLKQCLDRFGKGDAIVLLEDGIYGALTNHAYAPLLKKLQCCYVLEKDVLARGLNPSMLLANVELINYEKFVALTVTYKLSHSWY
jgi:tRNA 2-thiouridine synthesizing protein B